MSKRFESQSAILDGLFLTFICCKIVLMFEKTENKRKIGRDWPIKHQLQGSCPMIIIFKAEQITVNNCTPRCYSWCPHNGKFWWEYSTKVFECESNSQYLHLIKHFEIIGQAILPLLKESRKSPNLVKFRFKCGTPKLDYGHVCPSDVRIQLRNPVRFKISFYLDLWLVFYIAWISLLMEIWILLKKEKKSSSS